MSNVLNNIDNIIVYQDDILILTPDVKSHNDTLLKVLHTLKNCVIKLNYDIFFFCDQVKYLRYLFDKNGIRPNPDKITPII